MQMKWRKQKKGIRPNHSRMDKNCLLACLGLTLFIYIKICYLSCKATSEVILKAHHINCNIKQKGNTACTKQTDISQIMLCISERRKTKLMVLLGCLPQRNSWLGMLYSFFSFKIYKLFYISIKTYNCCLVLIRRNRCKMFLESRNSFKEEWIQLLVEFVWLTQ